MRISDWISDVCSSDLETVAGSVVAGNLVIDAHRSIAIHHCADGLHAASAECLCVYRDDLFHFHFGLQPQNPRRGVVVDYGSRSEEHTSELQSLMRISSAVFCLKKKTNNNNKKHVTHKQL